MHVIFSTSRISPFTSTTKAFEGNAIPALAPANTPNSAVVTVVLSNVIEVSPVIVPFIAKLPLLVIAPQLTVPNPVTFPFASNS